MWSVIDRYAIMWRMTAFVLYPFLHYCAKNQMPFVPGSEKTILLPGWKHQVLLNLHLSTTLHGVTFQKTVILYSLP